VSKREPKRRVKQPAAVFALRSPSLRAESRCQARTGLKIVRTLPSSFGFLANKSRRRKRENSLWMGAEQREAYTIDGFGVRNVKFVQR